MTCSNPECVDGRVPCPHQRPNDECAHNDLPGDLDCPPDSFDDEAEVFPCTIPCPNCAGEDRVACERYEGEPVPRGRTCENDCPTGADADCSVPKPPERFQIYNFQLCPPNYAGACAADANGKFELVYSFQAYGPRCKVHLRWMPEGEPIEGSVVWKLEVVFAVAGEKSSDVQEFVQVIPVAARGKETTEWELPYPEDVDPLTPCVWTLRLRRDVGNAQDTYRGNAVLLPDGGGPTITPVPACGAPHTVPKPDADGGRSYNAWTSAVLHEVKLALTACEECDDVAECDDQHGDNMLCELSEIRAAWVTGEQISAHVELQELKADNAALHKRVEELEGIRIGDWVGMGPSARLRCMSEFAMREFDHSIISNTPFEVSIVEGVAALRKRVEELEGGLESEKRQSASLCEKYATELTARVNADATVARREAVHEAAVVFVRCETTFARHAREWGDALTALCAAVEAEEEKP